MNDGITASGPAYRIESDRLVLRCWHPSDAPLLNSALIESWEHLGPWMPWAQGTPPTVSDTIAMLRRWRGEFDLNQDYVYGIFNRDESAVLGSTGLHTRRGEAAREIGYWIHVDQTNRGYATETATMLTRIAFEVEAVEWVEIRCLVDNVRSASVPRKLGYTHEATLRQRGIRGDGTRGDTMVWTLFATDYPHSPASSHPIRAYDAAGQLLLPQPQGTGTE